MTPQIPSITPLIALTLMTAPAMAQVYSWEDRDGNTVFSDTPAENRQVETIDPSENANPAIPLPEPRQRRAQPTENTSRSSSSPSREEQAQQRRCERIDERLERINTRLRRGYREPTGNRLRAQRRDLRKQRYRECR